MGDISLLFILGPPLIVTMILLPFVRSDINRRFCQTLFLIIWAKAFIDILQFLSGSVNYILGPAQGVNDAVLGAQFGLGIFYSGAWLLEELLLWGFVAFFAVLIGSFYLFITVSRKKGGSIADRMSRVSFSETLENPLISAFDFNSFETYLIIGLVTLPSMISIYVGVIMLGYSVFAVNVVYLALLLYRFSLMAYTRIAGKADLHLDKEDIGRKYQRRNLGWFTILNLIISVVTLSYTLVFTNVDLGTLANATLGELQELLVAILVLPFVEGFAVLFFQRFWRFWSRLGTRIRGIKMKPALYSLFRGLLVSGACFVLLYSILSFVVATTVFFSVGKPPTFNIEYGSGLIYDFMQLSGTGIPLALPSYYLLMLPMFWGLAGLFLFQFIKVLIGGSLTHRKGVAPEYSILVASITIAVLIWVLIPALNAFLGYFLVYLTAPSGAATWTRLILPTPLVSSLAIIYQFIPAPTDLLYILFLDLPIWVFGSLFLTYLFQFRRELIPAKKEPGVFRIPDFFKLFISFCIVVVASVTTIALIGPTTPAGDFVNWLLSKLWYPNASESLLFAVIGQWYVFFHNMLRFILTVFAPLLFWVSIVGIWKAWRRHEKVKSLKWYILAIALFALEAVFFADRFTYIAIIVIPLVLSALYRLFYRIVKRVPPKTMFRTTFLKIAFYSLILSEIYSTAISIADRYMFGFSSAGSVGLFFFLLELIPHGIVEIPAAILAGMIGLYIARRMTKAIDEDERGLNKFMAGGENLFWSRKVWYPIIFVTIFFVVAAALEIYVAWDIMAPLASLYGFA